jgi:hypothetical protein
MSLGHDLVLESRLRVRFCLLLSALRTRGCDGSFIELFSHLMDNC